jgi:hypothetical protein
MSCSRTRPQDYAKWSVMATPCEVLAWRNGWCWGWQEMLAPRWRFGLVQPGVIAGLELAMGLGRNKNKPGASAGSGAGAKLAPELAVGLELPGVIAGVYLAMGLGPGECCGRR